MKHLSFPQLQFMLFDMPFNYRTINFFSDYSCFENLILRLQISPSVVSSFPSLPEFVKVGRTFKNDRYFDFVRFFNLINHIFGYHKPFISRKSDLSFLLLRIFKSKFLYFLLRNLFRFRKTSKGSFLSIQFFENETGFISIREPHVAFLVSSRYFDYHNSKLSLNFNFSYKKNPQFLYKLTWLFGFL